MGGLAVSQLELAMARARAAAQQNTNPGVNPEAPPEMIYNPQTGQYTSRDMLRNNMGELNPLDAAVVGAHRGLSLGGADEVQGALNAAIPGKGTMAERYTMGREKMRAGEEAAMEQRPGSLVGGELAGAIATPVPALAQAGRFPVLGGMGTGAMIGGGYGFLSGEGEERIEDAKKGAGLGALLGGAIPAVGGRIQQLRDSGALRRQIGQAARSGKTTDELRAAGNAGYQAIDDMGVQIKPQSFEGARQEIIDYLQKNTGFDQLPGPGSLTPGTARVAQIMSEASSEMANTPGAALPFKALDQMRRQAGAAAGNVANRTDQRAGAAVIQGMDDFVAKMGDADVVSGDVGALQSALPKVREIWANMSKSQKLDDAIEAAESYVSGPASGLRNQFARILRSPKALRGFTPAEVAAIRRVANGTLPEQLVYLAAGGIGNVMSVVGGAAAGGLPGAVGGVAASAGLRKVAESLARRNAERARSAVASGQLKALPKADDAKRLIAQRLALRAFPVGSQ